MTTACSSGALDHTRFGLCERLLWALPASRNLLNQGDFRDWADVDAWAAGITRALAPAPAAEVRIDGGTA